MKILKVNHCLVSNQLKYEWTTVKFTINFSFITNISIFDIEHIMMCSVSTFMIYNFIWNRPCSFNILFLIHKLITIVFFQRDCFYKSEVLLSGAFFLLRYLYWSLRLQVGGPFCIFFLFCPPLPGHKSLHFVWKLHENS